MCWHDIACDDKYTVLYTKMYNIDRLYDIARLTYDIVDPSHDIVRTPRTQDSGHRMSIAYVGYVWCRTTTTSTTSDVERQDERHRTPISESVFYDYYDIVHLTYDVVPTRTLARIQMS